MTRKINRLLVTVFFTLVILGLLLVVKGDTGDQGINFQTDLSTTLGGPFEGSNSTSRYALVVALVKNHTFFFSTDLAKFAAPDVVYYQGKYFSLFTPGVSLVAAPFYWLGLKFQAPQIFAYSVNLVFAVFNLCLIALITRKLGANWPISLLSGFIFTFATNVLPYSLTLTQHPGTTTILLLSLLITFRDPTFSTNISLGILLGAGILFDIPNLLLLLPVAFYTLGLHFSITTTRSRYKISFRPVFIGFILGILPPILFFASYNYQTAGSYFKISQTIGRTEKVTDETSAQIAQEPVPHTPLEPQKLALDTRSQLNGLYTLLISNERSWLYYSPVLLVGVLGVVLASRDPKIARFSILSLSIIAANIVTYSMFGDPWGGWSFGPRYLIPSAAVLSVFLGYAFIKLKANLVFFILFLLLSLYSLYISSVGAITTVLIPPKIEAETLSTPIPYTYEYNFQLIKKNFSGSLFYNTYLKSLLSSVSYLNYYVTGLYIVTVSLAVLGLQPYDRH